MLRVSPERRSPDSSGPLFAADVGFLRDYGAPERVLRLSEAIAGARGTQPLQELFASGLDPITYWSLLAQHLGLPFAADLEGAVLLSAARSTTTQAIRRASSVVVEIDGVSVAVIAPAPDEWAHLRSRLAADPGLANRIRIAAPETIRAFLVRRRHTALVHYAVHRLPHVLPRLSVHRLGMERLRQPMTLAMAYLGLMQIAPLSALAVLGVLSTVFFFNCAVWKAIAAFRRHPVERRRRVSSAELPSYTVLVPLYREARVVPDLVRSLTALDYPALRSKSTRTAEAI